MSNTTTSTNPKHWATLARPLRPQGRKGELLCDLLTDLDPDTQFHTGRSVMLAAPKASEPAANAVPVIIEGFFLPTGKNAGRIVLKLSGCDSISQAELLAGRQLMVPAEELPTLDPDTFYVSDLIGCTLFNGPTPIGKVVDVQFAMSPDGKTRLPEAAPLLGLHPTGAPEDTDPILIPFVLAHLASVDLAAKRIHMNLPKGLLEAEEPNTA
jgi:16S rRNA processing protein RimM